MSFWSRIFRLLPNKVEDEQLTNLTQVAFGLNVETLESEKTTPEAKQDAKAYLDRFWETDSAGRNQGEPDWMVAMNAKSERGWKKAALKGACRSDNPRVRYWAGVLLRRHYFGW